MYIVGENRQKIVLKEISYGVLYKAIITFVAALMITLNGVNNEATSSFTLFVVGPLLMVASFLFALYFFRNITITFDKQSNRMIREIKRPRKTTIENVTLEDLNIIEIIPKDKIIGDIGGVRSNLYLKYNDSDYVQINYDGLKRKKSAEIASCISKFLQVPFARVHKPGVIESIKSLKEIIK